MNATAKLRGARISAQKVRLVADQVRGMPVEKAEQLLAFSTKKAARIMKKVLLSAIANAEHNDGAAPPGFVFGYFFQVLQDSAT